MPDLTRDECFTPEQTDRQWIVLETGLQNFEGVVRSLRTTLSWVTAIDISPFALADQLQELPRPDRVWSGGVRKTISRR